MVADRCSSSRPAQLNGQQGPVRHGTIERRVLGASAKAWDAMRWYGISATSVITTDRQRRKERQTARVKFTLSEAFSYGFMPLSFCQRAKVSHSGSLVLVLAGGHLTAPSPHCLLWSLERDDAARRSKERPCLWRTADTDSGSGLANAGSKKTTTGTRAVCL